MGLHLKERLTSYIEPYQPLLNAIKYHWVAYKTRQGATSSIQDRAFADWYKDMSPLHTNYENTTGLPSLAAAARGTVLELGPGPGNQLQRYNASAITRLYGVECNLEFTEVLQARITEAHLDDIYTPIFCDIQDADALERHGIVEGSLDCVTSFQVLCCIRDPNAVVSTLWKLLKPGGELIFWEHGANADWVTYLVQKFWSLVWPTARGGCHLDRRTVDILLQSADWEVVELNYEGEKWHIMPRASGRLRKLVLE
ncbi:S-adenosyl-L-methionine-dependent methyltransferase [Aspergillus heteromorphus CBS 117.55]|uniref:S-adenosyl-L-methionine-dependent methyltransferase n=1 Tax=Aspergillus heteromorphus CBS 117.55 TaxID=1448321 RepID=A0A317X4W8_9EURO|nr:S-adenosyl-L-methionine-dependent methyltransferase [Aspergillus heteromorphus CBS 117.55]PWY92567.1 S-adenosyl-L-methionine-dependent methyltransferase [Aspergillus heteromorphus CBS 117.55]